MSKAHGLLTGALIGIGLGALGGILFAPRKGEETRKELKLKARLYGKRLQKISHHLQKEGEKIKDNFQQRGQELVEDAQGKVDQVLEKTSQGKRRFFKGV